MIKIVLLRLGGWRFNSDQLANVVKHAQHEGFVRLRITGQRCQGPGGQRGGQRVSPEISELLPFVTAQLE